MYKIAAEYLPKDRAAVQRVARVALGLEKIHDDGLIIATLDSAESILNHVNKTFTELVSLLTDIKETIKESDRKIMEAQVLISEAKRAAIPLWIKIGSVIGGLTIFAIGTIF